MNRSVPSSSPVSRKRFGAIVAIVAVLGSLLTLGGAAASAQAAGTGSISGNVQGAGSPNVALQDAAVALYGPGINQLITVVNTDAQGNFSFTGVAAGSYTLDIQSPDSGNFAEQWWHGKPDNSSANFFSVTNGQARTGFDVVLAVGSTLSGTELGVGTPNVPIANGFVLLHSTSGLQHAQTFTDAEGHFTIQAIEAGTYELEFVPSSNSSTYIPQWWKDQSVEGNAQTVTIGAGKNLTGYNEVLPLAASISGTVIGADTMAGLFGARVQALNDGSTGGTANVAADGSYTIQGLVAGTYTLKFTPAFGQNYLSQYWNNQSTLATADTIAVAGGQALTGYNATLAVGASITGTVTTIEAPTVGFEGAFVSAADATGNYAGSATADSHGHYTIAGLAPGTYRVQFAAPYRDSHASQFWQNATTFENATPLTLTAHSVTTGINATLTEGASVSGKVTEAADPTVAIPYPDVFAQSPSGTIVGNTVGDATGNYELTGLPATTVVIEFAGTDGGAFKATWWKNHSSLSSATRISLTSGAALTGINGTMAPAYVTPGSPTISGTLAVGHTLTAHHGTWKPSDTTFTYQWKRGGSAIAGATNGTYKLVSADAGHTITVDVTGDRYHFNDVTVTSPATATITGTLTTVVPQITGTATLGSVLTAVPGAWGPGTVKFTYQWSRAGNPINGATHATHTVSMSEVGKALTVTVTGTETGFTTVSVASLPTTPTD